MRKTRHILHSIALVTLATPLAIGASASDQSPDKEQEPATNTGEATVAAPITAGSPELPDTPAGALVNPPLHFYDEDDLAQWATWFETALPAMLDDASNSPNYLIGAPADA